MPPRACYELQDESHMTHKGGQHQNGKSQEMQALQGSGQALVVACQTTKARHPAERALDHPATRQQDKTLLGFRQFDDFQLDTVLGSGLLRFRPAVALVNKRQFDTLSSDLLDLLSELRHLRAILLVGG